MSPLAEWRVTSSAFGAYSAKSGTKSVLAASQNSALVGGFSCDMISPERALSRMATDSEKRLCAEMIDDG